VNSCRIDFELVALRGLLILSPGIGDVGMPGLPSEWQLLHRDAGCTIATGVSTSTWQRELSVVLVLLAISIVFMVVWDHCRTPA